MTGSLKNVLENFHPRLKDMINLKRKSIFFRMIKLPYFKVKGM